MKRRLLIVGAMLLACAPDETDPLREIQPEEVRIVRHSPDRAALVTQPIEIEFSEPLVGPSEVGIEVPAEELLVVSPALPGRCRWTAQNKLRFIPEAPFLQGARYHVDVRPSVVGAGQVLVGSTTFEFPTRMFTLLSTEVTPRPEARTARVVLEFSHDVRAAEANAAVAFYRPDGAVVPARIVTAEAGRLMTFLLGPLRGDFGTLPVEVHVDGSLRATFGGRSLEKDVVRPIDLAPEPILRIVGVESFQVEERLGVRVRLNRTVDEPTLRSALRIQPNVQAEIVAVHHGFEILGPFEPNRAYTISLSAGIKSPDGYLLPERVAESITTTSLAPALRLTREAGPLELKSVNVGRVDVTVTKVWDNNVAHLLGHLDRDTWPAEGTLGPVVYRGVVETAGRTDNVVTAVVPYDDPYPRRRGLYLVEVVDAERAWVRAHTVIFDDGLSLTAKVGASSVRAEVRSPETLRPVYGAEVRVISRTNRSLGTTHTAPNGLAELTIDADANDPPTWVIARRDRAFSYLPLPHSDALPGAVDDEARGPAYIFGDRTSHHPGDHATIGLLLRDDGLGVSAKKPPTLEVKDPVGRFVAATARTRMIDGAVLYDVPIPHDAREGRYEIRAVGLGGATLGRHRLWVEEPTPPRLVAKTTAADEAGPRAPAFVVEGRYRLGDKAAAGLVLRTRCRYRERPMSSDAFDSFMFARSSGRPLDLVEREVESRLDAEGRGRRFCPAVRAAGASGPVTITLEASVVEPGGRVVKDETSVTHQSTPHYVGVRRRPEAGPASVGQDAGLEVVVVGPNGDSAPNVAFTATVRSLDGVAAPADVQASSLSRAVRIPYVTREPGRHRVDVETAEGASSSMLFWVLPDEGSEVPAPDGQLVIVGHHVDHRPGDVASFLVWSPFAGRVDLTIERDRVLRRRRVDVGSMVSKIEVPVLPAYLPNVNVVARLTNGRRVAYASAPLAVSTQSNRLDASIGVPSRAIAGKPLTVRLKSSSPAHAIVWAVPKRRLDPTVDRPADPLERFVGDQPTALSTHDMLAPSLPDRVSELGVDRRSRPRVEWGTGRSVWSSIVPVDETTDVTLDLPFVHGPVRVAAVLFAGDRFGAVHRTIDVQDPLRIVTSTPRFLRPGDRLSVPIEVENGLDRTVQVDLRIDTRGPLTPRTTDRQASVEGRRRARVDVDVAAADRIGAGSLVLRARAGTSSTTVRRRVAIVAGRRPEILGASYEVDRARPLAVEVPSDFVLGSAELTLTIGPTALFGHRAALDAVLERSSESRRGVVDEVMALLHASRLRPKSSARLPAALERLAAYGGGRDTFESAKYALAVFEAVRAGYAVDRSAVERARQRMHAVVTDAKKRSSPMTRALAHFVLALAERPERRALIELAEAWSKPEASAEPHARAVLASAAMKAGMLTLGRKLIDAELPPSPELDPLVLSVLADVQPFHPVVRRLTEALRGRALDARWRNQEENALALVAVKKGARLSSDDRPYWGTVLVDGVPVERFNAKRSVVRTVPLDEWRGRNVTVEVTGAGRAFAGVTVRGVRTGAPEVRSTGIELERTRHTVTGDPRSGPLPLGELVVTTLAVRCVHSTTCGRVVVDERIVAGLEVEEPRLRGLDWLSRGSGRPRTSVRDDRIRYEMVLDEGDTLYAYYSARAVASGSFGVPAAVAYAPDDPNLIGVSPAGTLVVQPAP